MNEEKDRIAYWDNLKFFMVLLMVIGHFVLPFYEQSALFKSIHLFIYAFHMPVLLFASGYFFHESNSKKKCLFYMSCGLLLKTGFSICDFLLLKPVSFWMLYEGDIPWFMFSLGYYCLLMPMINKFDRKHVLIVSILLSCAIGYDTSNADFLVLFRTIVFFPFYYMGYLYRQHERHIAKDKFFKYTLFFEFAAALVLILWGVLCFYKRDFVSDYLHVFKGRFSYTEKIVKYGMIARLGCIVVTLLTGISVMQLCPRKRIPWLSEMGAKTINVYFWHWLIYKIPDNGGVFQMLFQSGTYGRIAYLCISVVLCCAIASIPVFDWPLKQLRHAILLK